MKVALLIGVLVCLLVCGQPSVSAQQSWQAYVTAEQAPVYKEMNTSSQILATLPNGTPVAVYFAVQSIQGSWCKVALQNEHQNFGFVICSQIRRGQAPPNGAASSDNRPAPECTLLVDQLMDASGAKSALSHLSGEFFSSILAATARGLAAQQRADLLAIVEREFGGPALDTGVRRGFLNRCDPGSFHATLEALQNPLVVRMIKLEDTARNPAKGAENKRYAANLRQNPPPPERAALIRRLDQASGGSQFLIDVMLDVLVTMGSAVTGHTPKPAELETLRNQMTAQIRESVVMASAALYRSVSDEDLKEYSRLWESPPLKDFNELSKGVFQEVMETQSRTVGAELKAYIESRRARAAAR